MRALLAMLALTLAGPARAADAIDQAQMAELDRVRAEVADQIHLAAYDLIDELVYRWMNDPVFDQPTPVVLAGVTVPVGLGSGLQGMLENHLVSVLTQNPTTNVQLVHCPQCTAVIVHSGPEGTVVSRGIDNPKVLAELGEDVGRHALFIDVEAEGAFLVLRARLTRLTPELPIVWSHTLSTSTSTPALLRESSDLKSAEEAREEYLAALRGRGQLTIPVRLGIRAYAQPGGQGTPPPPFPWIQSGLEMSPTDARRWTSSVLVGYTVIPQAYQGVMAQARISRLITGRVRSLTRPDLYVFVGGAVIGVWGPATASFQNERLTIDQIITGNAGDDPRNAFATFQWGADLRLGNRMGFSAFLETIPSLLDSRNMGSFFTIGQVEFQSFGGEVTFCF
ncbi:MAG: hypothetical protein H6739_15695 [Alphaproteobacteria bacterium]|nr:hypothetical protein [Alphaproteobacteria bacterium]